MARTGVTYLDVAKVADSLRNKGVQPTIDNVRYSLGTGSRTTITNHLKQWRSRTLDDTELQSLPNELAKFVKNLFEQLKSQAELNIEKPYEQAREEIEVLKKKIKDEQLTGKELSKEISLIKLDNEKLNKKCLQQDSSMKDKDNIIEQFNMDNKELTIRLQEKEDQLKTLKNQLTSVETNSEHYLSMLKQQRDGEISRMSEQIHKLQQELISIRNEKKVLFNQCAKLDKDKSELSMKIVQNQQLYENQMHKVEGLSDKNMNLTLKLSKIQEKYEFSNKQLDKLEADLKNKEQYIQELTLHVFDEHGNAKG